MLSALLRFFRHCIYIFRFSFHDSIEIHNMSRYNIPIRPNTRRFTMEHYNPLLTNKSSHKFITIGEIMLRLTPPNY